MSSNRGGSGSRGMSGRMGFRQQSTGGSRSTGVGSGQRGSDSRDLVNKRELTQEGRGGRGFPRPYGSTPEGTSFGVLPSPHPTPPPQPPTRPPVEEQPAGLTGRPASTARRARARRRMQGGSGAQPRRHPRRRAATAHAHARAHRLRRLRHLRRPQGPGAGPGSQRRRTPP